MSGASEDPELTVHGEAVVARCAFDPNDALGIAVIAEDGTPAYVGVEAVQFYEGDPRPIVVHISLLPGDARAIGAALLNCADTIEGVEAIGFDAAITELLDTLTIGKKSKKRKGKDVK